MAIKSIELENFRSYQHASYEFSPKLNLILGLNGSGKTNLLEAIYVLANASSWRAKDKDLINYHGSRYRVSGVLDSGGAAVGYQQTNQGPQKRLTVNNKALKTREYLGKTRVVLFEPGSLGIIIGSPSDRRRWLNRVLAVSRPTYLDNLLKYRHILRQRNALLKRRNLTAISDQIFAWDISLVESASKLVRYRQEFIEQLNKRVGNLYRQLAGEGPAISLRYVSNVKEDDYSSSMLAKLEASIEQDAKLGFTTAGPHRDDIAVSFDHKPAQLSASRGETRTLVLAMKLVESRWLGTPTKQPILLLDDVFSELDNHRRQFVIKRIKNQQVFITATDVNGLKPSLPKTRHIIKL